ncbi:PP2C family protein-serine/threonine phosphatase [Clavibacter nebraskensis]|uniref:PPM-type phosphatase domain-containing protein n=3 Tax=Clavibacter nebraskensis TaxID=31963 RepID=A0AAI8ZHY5_9MICO|nr:protein phosphatase 2C domain-containing protein [Clavibacter nebraskensis]KXU21021.1 serine/threonine protein phosphatase [Clavibacter nebraskensis]OAH22266.1 serine/threonine protein phosphatase [Clavibacter nebraskensis]QGV66499.1 serine/threonine-protein phosphatase [Clavibacter nebraskensis]QGV69298.1 serine/threonine-protein phosphatase [Clavibacter nebraskensis]QGV72088.1 serine/threonine-protein phosphatase [Clavibacter nebraskensis]
MTEARTIALGGRRIHVSWAARTDVGSVRAVNEDGLLADPPVWLVADGMGGHAFGDRASATLVETFGGLSGDAPVTRDLIVEAVDASNDAIGDLITGDDPPGTVAGTTLAGVALVRSDAGDPLWMVFNVGDSRVYAWTDGRLEQVTIDHSAVQELVDQGRMTRAEAERSPVRNLITRAVGSHDEVAADEWLLPVVDHQVFLICSDGLTKELDDPAISGVLQLARADGGGVDRAADALVAQALASGGRDNVTVVVMEAAADAEPLDDGSAGAPTT